MKRCAILFFCLTLLAVHNAMAQKVAYDSSQIMAKARREAVRFRLSQADLKLFNQEHFPATSDYFKPVANRRTVTALLNDSLYVKTYKTAAFFEALQQRPAPTFGQLLHPPRPGREEPQQNYFSKTELSARRDAKKCSLPISQIERVKAGRVPNTSDFFKPNTKTTADTTLLRDSVYVKTFRYEAFNKTYYQKGDPKGNGILAAQITVVSAVALVLLLTVAVRD